MRRRSRMVVTILLRLYFVYDPGQVLAIGNRIRMLRPKNFLTDAECPLAKRLRLCIMTLSNVEFGQVVESFSGSGMLRSKRFLKDSEGPLPKGLGPLMVSLFVREPCQQIEVMGNEGVPRLQD